MYSIQAFFRKDKILTLLFFIVAHFSIMGQEANADTLKTDSKFSLGIGAGTVHSNLGVKPMYQITKSLSVYVGVGIGQLNLEIPSLGLEYTLYRSKNNRLTIYASTQFKTISFKLDGFIDEFNSTSYVEESMLFPAPSVGGGLLFRAPGRGFSLNFGMQYQFIDNTRFEQFKDDFGMEHGISYEGVMLRSLRPTLSVVLHFKK